MRFIAIVQFTIAWVVLGGYSCPYGLLAGRIWGWWVASSHHTVAMGLDCQSAVGTDDVLQMINCPREFPDVLRICSNVGDVRNPAGACGSVRVNNASLFKSKVRAWLHRCSAGPQGT